MGLFVWADLSTYDPKSSQRFYKKVFGWKFQNVGGYRVAYRKRTEIAGLYETPDFFKQINMPHFWMSYVGVADALAVAERARSFDDAVVELADEFYGGNIALIRDPQGAGFTVYDGGQLDGRRTETGTMVWNELHVSDASHVVPFYEALFDWVVEPGGEAGAHRILFGGEHIGDINELPNDVKGEYEYWVCTFGVDDLARTKERVVDNGGGLVIDEGHRMLMHDDSGEAFFYIQAG